MDPLRQQIARNQNIVACAQVHTDLVSTNRIEPDDRQFIIPAPGSDVIALAHPQDRRLG